MYVVHGQPSDKPGTDYHDQFNPSLGFVVVRTMSMVTGLTPNGEVYYLTQVRQPSGKPD